MKARLARNHKGSCCDYLHSQKGFQLSFSSIPPFVYALKPDGGLKVTTLLQLTQGLGKQKKYISMASMTRKQALGCICCPWAFLPPHMFSVCLFIGRKKESTFIVYTESTLFYVERAWGWLLGVSSSPPFIKCYHQVWSLHWPFRCL